MCCVVFVLCCDCCVSAWFGLVWFGVFVFVLLRVVAVFALVLSLRLLCF